MKFQSSKIERIGFNSSIRNWTNLNILYYARTIPLNLKTRIEEDPRESKPLDLTSKEVSESVFKNFNISTILIRK